MFNNSWKEIRKSLIFCSLFSLQSVVKSEIKTYFWQVSSCSRDGLCYNAWALIKFWKEKTKILLFFSFVLVDQFTSRFKGARKILSCVGKYPNVNSLFILSGFLSVPKVLEDSKVLWKTAKMQIMKYHKSPNCIMQERALNI